MEERLFRSKSEQAKKRKEINSRSILHCNLERKKLRDCFRNSWFGYCSKEQSAFWDCFNKERDRLNLLENHIEIPKHHWADQPHLPATPTTTEDKSLQ